MKNFDVTTEQGLKGYIRYMADTTAANREGLAKEFGLNLKYNKISDMAVEKLFHIIDEHGFDSHCLCDIIYAVVDIINEGQGIRLQAEIDVVREKHMAKKLANPGGD